MPQDVYFPSENIPVLAEKKGITPDEAVALVTKAGIPIRGQARALDEVERFQMDNPRASKAIQATPDVIQGAGAVGGAVAGSSVGQPGLGGVVGGAAGSVLANTLRQINPQLFGDPTSLQKEIKNLTGVNLSTDSLGIPDFASSVADDVIADLAVSVPGIGKQALKTAIARGSGKAFGKTFGVRAASPELDNAFKSIIKELGVEIAPKPRVGSGSSMVKTLEKIGSPKALEDFIQKEIDNVRIGFPKLTGAPIAEGDLRVPSNVIDAFNKSVFRKGNNSLKLNVGEYSARTANAIEFAIEAEKRFVHMRNGANNLWGRLRSVLGDQKFTLSKDTIDNISALKNQVDDQFVAGTPEIKASLRKLKGDLDALIPEEKLPTTITKETTFEEIIDRPKGSTVKTGGKTATKSPTEETLDLSEVTEGKRGTTTKTRTQTTSITKTPQEVQQDLIDLNGEFTFDQLQNIQSALAGDIPTTANISFGERNRLDVLNQLKSEIEQNIASRPDGPALVKLHENAIAATRARYEIFPPEIQKSLSKEASTLWDKVFKNEDSAKAFIAAAGPGKATLNARTEVMMRMFQQATDSKGQLNPQKLKEIWNNNDGLRAAFSRNQKNTLSQYFELLNNISTDELSQVGQVALGFRLGSFAIGLPASVVGGYINPLGTGATITALVSANRFFKNVVLGGGEFSRAAIRLSKNPPGSPEHLKDVRTVLSALHGTKVALVSRDKDGNTNVIDPEFKISSRRGVPRRAGFGQFGQNRR